jgi:hypothetical protein
VYKCKYEKCPLFTNSRHFSYLHLPDLFPLWRDSTYISITYMQLFAPSIGMLGNAGFPTFLCEICSKTGSLSVGLDNNLIELIYMTVGDICHNNIRRVTDKVF